MENEHEAKQHKLKAKREALSQQIDTRLSFRKLPSIYVFSYFPFGFEGRMWDLIVSVPDHCLSFDLIKSQRQKENGRTITNESRHDKMCFRDHARHKPACAATEAS